VSRPRRDPRAEAARRAVPGGARPRSTIEVAATAPASGRPRRDPRAELAALLVPAVRRRLDRSLAAGGGAPAVDAAAGHGGAAVAAAGGGAATTPAVRTIAAPSCFVLVVPDLAAGRATAHDRQLLGAARLLADAAGGAVVVMADGGEWGPLGVDRVLSEVDGGERLDPARAANPPPSRGRVGKGGAANSGSDVDHGDTSNSSGEAAGIAGVAPAAAPLPTLPREGGGEPRADAAAVIAPAPSSDPARRAAAIVAAIRILSPRHVVFAETADGGDLARRVAARLGEPLFAGAESVTARMVTRPAKAGRVEQRTAPPRLLSVLADVVAAHAGPPHEARPETLADLAAEAAGGGAGPVAGEAGEDAAGVRGPGPAPRPGASARLGAPVGAVLSSEVIPADPATVPLAEAGFVLSAGNGVTDFAAFHALAAALRATPGASRVVCDAGLMPRDRQVGASGTVLDATCYFALGIAGAPQHLQGVAKCEHVVAVNTDLHAAMIERAGLAVVADAQAVMPALLALLAEAAAGGEDGHRAADASATAAPEPAGLDAALPEPLTARVLLSAGRHPVSGRPAPVRAEAQATALALALGARVEGLHLGTDAAAVADHLGHGLGDLAAIAAAEGADPVPALVAALRADGADLVLAGRRGEGGEDSGLVPYRIADALGWPLVADVVAAMRDPSDPSVLVVDQALPRGARRRVRVRLPAVVTVHPAAPPPRPFAFAPARRGRITPRTVEAPRGATPLSIEERPWRRRPRLIAGAATAGSAAERLKAATEVAGGGGRLLVDPDPAEAAREILAFLRDIGVLAPTGA
jgi:electron transfer flavoprotein alpha subunit